ncbi:MAG: DUF1289 domain-containing protein [Erythrobacter sp.]|nr:DUF1289 domain-containing protein [Erythrobacter sp.]
MKEVASPCIKVCRLDPDELWCTGCGRSLAEIAAWTTASEEEKGTITRKACERRAAARSNRDTQIDE